MRPRNKSCRATPDTDSWRIRLPGVQPEAPGVRATGQTRLDAGVLRGEPKFGLDCSSDRLCCDLGAVAFPGPLNGMGAGQFGGIILGRWLSVRLPWGLFLRWLSLCGPRRDD